MSGFSHEIRHHQIASQGHRCALLKLEVDILEGHHCCPRTLNGSNNNHNCIMLAGYGAYSVYGFPVEDIHEKYDRLALDEGLFLHPDTLELVTRDKLPLDCFKDNQMPEIRKTKKKKKIKK